MPESPRYGDVFDGIAEAYDARRSGYPSELVATAAELAGLGSGSRVVEVGSGTGKLTEELVAYGLHVDAVDPGRNLIELARRRVGDSELVRFHLARFEEVALPEARFEAVFSAAAFHWVDPSSGWAKVAALLRPGGTVALIQPISVRDGAGGQALDELAAAFTRLAPELAAERPMPRDLATIQAGADERKDNVSEVWAWLAHPALAVAEAGTLFGPALLTCFTRELAQTADELWKVFETTSWHHRLPTAVRAKLKAEHERIIDRHGGLLRSTRLAALVTAQRR